MRHCAALVLLLLFSLLLLAQNIPGAEAAADRARIDTINDRLKGHKVAVEDASSRLQKMTPADFQRIENKRIEMNRLVVGVNKDFDNANRGVLAADIGDKLKRIEKLAKQLRKEFE
jgi:hypothetical protein